MKNKKFRKKHHSRLMLDRLLNQVFLKFLDISEERLEAAINESLKLTGTFFGLDRIYIYQFLEDDTIMNLIYEWCRDGVVSKKSPTRDELAYEFPWLMRKIRNNESIIVGNPAELPDEAFSEREMMAGCFVRSCLVIPLMYNGKILAFMGLDSVYRHMSWEQDYLNTVQVLGRIFISNIQRISNEKSLKLALYENSLILDNSDVQIWSLKNTTVYGAVNNAHAGFFGKSKEEMRYQDLNDVFVPETANLLCEKNWDLFQQKAQVERELWIDNSMGEKRLLLIKSKPMTDIQGNIEYLVCTAADVTEQKRAQDDIFNAKRAAEEANIAKSQFLANMSHEIRTPMNGIVGYIELLEGTGLAPQQKTYLKEVRDASEVLLYLLNDILDFSKIEAGRINLEAISFNLRSAVESTVMLYAPKACEKGLEICIMINPDVPGTVEGDPVRLKQVLNNLISNSVKFTETGEVCVCVEKIAENDESCKLRFEVIDTGIGISDESVKRLFSPFTQLDASTTRKYGGTGLGLVISKKLVELMGGEISVDSKLGEGSKFCFTVMFSKGGVLKESTERSYETLKGNEAQKNTSWFKPHILLVEDNEVNRNLVVLMLQSKGLACDIAVNGKEAVEACINKAYDIVFMDCQMPEMDGYEATARIRGYEGDRRYTTIVAMTANAMEGDREKCLTAGMDDYISKPVRNRGLMDIIYKYCTNFDK